MNAWEWLTDSANWSGAGGIPTRLLEHVEISAVAMVIACAIAIPAGLVIGHTRRAEFAVVQIANLGRAIPSFAILSISFQLILQFAPGIAFGFLPAVAAMVVLAIPPILTNTYVGVQQVDPGIVESARGMGMTGRQTLRSIELPLATPLVVAGCRTAAVQVVATATLAALVAGGGLGRFIVDGFATGARGRPEMIGGAILVATLAILTEAAFALIARVTAPRIQSRRARPETADGSPAPATDFTV